MKKTDEKTAPKSRPIRPVRVRTAVQAGTIKFKPEIT
jgi:hypothetical protein